MRRRCWASSPVPNGVAGGSRRRALFRQEARPPQQPQRTKQLGRDADAGRALQRKAAGRVGRASGKKRGRRTSPIGRGSWDAEAVKTESSCAIRRGGWGVKKAALARSRLDRSSSPPRTTQLESVGAAGDAGVRTVRGGRVARRRVDAAPTHSCSLKHPLVPPTDTLRADCSCASPARAGGHGRREQGVSRSRTGLAPCGRTTTCQLSYAVSWRRRTRWRRRRVVQRGDARSPQRAAAAATATAQRGPASRGCDAPQRA